MNINEPKEEKTKLKYVATGYREWNPIRSKHYNVVLIAGKIDSYPLTRFEIPDPKLGCHPK